MEAYANGNVIQTSDIHGPESRTSPSKRTNSSRRDDATWVNPVQTQSEGRSVGAETNSSGVRQQPAATLAEKEVAIRKSNMELVIAVASSKRRNSTASA